MLPLLVALASLQEPVAADLSAPVLRPGETLEGQITDDEPAVRSAGLDTPTFSGEPVLGRTIRVEVDESGPCYIELRAYTFDPYLVLRSAQGEVLAEDDDGLLERHARISATLLAGTAYELQVCAPFGDRGPFELRMVAGIPPSRSKAERERRKVGETRKRVRALESAGPSARVSLAAALTDLGAQLEIRGAYDAAGACHERAIAICEDELGRDHWSTLACVNNLAVLLENQGFFDQARPLLERCLHVLEAELGPDHVRTAVAANNLGTNLQKQAQYEEARELFERALAVFRAELGDTNASTESVTNNLAVVARSSGRAEEALRLQLRALEIGERTSGEDDPDTARSRINLASQLKQLGRLDEAALQNERAISTLAAYYGHDHPSVARALHNLAGVRHLQGQSDEAVDLLEQALELRERVLGIENWETLWTLNNLASVLFDRGQTKPAWDVVSRAAPARSEFLRRTLATQSEQENHRYLARVRQQLELSLTLSAAVGEEAAVEAYETVLEWKGQVTRLAAQGPALRSERIGREEQEIVASLRAVQQRMSAAISGRASSGEDLDELCRIRNDLELRWRRLASRGRVERPTFRDVLSRLPPRSAAIDFLVSRPYVPPARDQRGAGQWDRPHVTAWISRPGVDRPRRVELGPLAELEHTASAFLHAIAAGAPAAPSRGIGVTAGSGAESAERLRALLWDPLAPHLQQAEVVFVCPDSVLGCIPFEVLPRSGGGLLIEQTAFVYLAALVDLPEGPPPAPAIGDLLCMGGVDFGGQPTARATGLSAVLDGTWSNLPHTLREVESILALHAAVLGDAHGRLVLAGDVASEGRLVRELQRHAVVHLATHGFFQPSALRSSWSGALEAEPDAALQLAGRHPGLLSGLVCSAPGSADRRDLDDGYLTAEEVGWLDLSGVDLVVLSACETGLGRPAAGEGLIGLRRAFHTAGSNTIVSSLWNVPDESTAELMRDFYSNLWVTKMGRLEALRQAQLKMLNRNRADRGDPLPMTWGAFVLSGEWR
jgi:tetratricopeptide (TPR) repeat protein